ncbi:MAG: AAA family ATPase [Thermodesulfobacteriota bacterium]|nr:AAA family ATPase [Thermodesulfobacteriota bacterium]
MKIAISGKGGVGKTTLSALLIRALNDEGKRVLAIDADPDANLAAAVGIPDADAIVPIAEMKELIAERTGSQPGTIGGFFKLNPKVDDLPESLSAKLENIKLMKLGGVKGGGAGCICPESALLKALITHITLLRDDVVVMDMEAGLEHLGRATASAVDQLIVVVEPGRRSIETALQVKKLASEINLTRVSVFGNKIRSEKDEAFLRDHLPDFTFAGFMPYNEGLVDADLSGTSPYDATPSIKETARDILSRIKPS